MGSIKTSKLNRVIAKLTKAATKARKRKPTQQKSTTLVRQNSRMKFGLTKLNSPIPMYRISE